MYNNYGYDDNYDEYSFPPKNSIYNDYDGYDKSSYDVYLTDDDYLDMINTCSSNDCTGLLVNGKGKIQELENYDEVYNVKNTKM